MESLPFTYYSTTAEDPTVTVPLAAISPSGEHYDIVNWHFQFYQFGTMVL